MKSEVLTNFFPNFDFTVKAPMSLNYSYRQKFEMKADVKVKICFFAKLCMQNKILNPKMQNL